MSANDTIAWTREGFAAARDQLERKLEVRESTPAKQLHFCLDHLLNVESLQQPSKHFESIVYGFTALALHEREGGLSDAQIDRIVEIVESLLKVNGIRPAEGVSSFFYSLLYQSVARIRTASGRQWDGLFAFYRSQSAGRRGKADDQIQTELSATFHALACGSSTLAWHHLNLASSEIQPGSAYEPFLLLTKCTLHRLGAEPGEALEILTKVEAMPDLPPDLRPVRAWERLWADCLTQGSARQAARLAKPERNAELGAFALDLWFWGRGLATADGPMVLPTLRACRDRVMKSALPIDRALHKAAQLLEECHDGDRPFEKRLALASEALAVGRSATTIERRLLVIAAIVRWLVRSNQFALAAASLGSYQGLSLQASRNKTRDALGMLGDLNVDKLLERHGVMKRPNAARAPADVSPGLGKSLVDLAAISKVFVEASALILKGRISKWVSRPGESRRLAAMDNEAAIGRLVSAYLRKRRGVLLKIGQICGYLDGPIASHVMQEFEVLQSDVEPMSYESVVAMFVDQLGHGPETLYAEFEKQPFAAGSIGQVHRARLHSGEFVAVKVQYPDVRKIMDIDLARGRWVMKFFEKRLPGTDLDALFAEGRERLLDEADYRLEADNLADFTAAFAEDASVVIPKVFRELTNEKILTMEYVSGATFAQFAEAATQAEKDRAAETIFRVFSYSSVVMGRFNADPHPGNFLFNGPKVALLDFGCVKRLPQAVLAHRNAMFRAFFDGDTKAFSEHYVGAGFAKSLDGAQLEKSLAAFRVLVGHSLVDAPFQFTEAHPTKVYQAYISDSEWIPGFTFPRDFLFLIRFDFGLMSLLGKLNATFNARDIALPYFFGQTILKAPPVAEADPAGKQAS